MSSDDKEAPAHELVIVRHHHGDHGDEHHGGVWKIAYADFMTAMMAFFLVMWLINSTDKQTVAQSATYFNPLKMSDKVTSKKGVKELEPGDPAQEQKDETPKNEAKIKGQSKQAAGGGKGEKGKEDAASISGDKSEGIKTTQEEELFKDPYNILATIASRAPKEKKRIFGEKKPGGAKERGGEAFRDPFDPEFRKTPSKSGDERSKVAPGVDAAGGGAGGKDVGGMGIGGLPAVASPDAPSRDNEPAAAAAAETAKLEGQIKEAVETLEPGSLPNIEVRNTDEGRLISLTDQFDFSMFPIGSAEPRPELVSVMDKIGKIIAEQPGSVVVRGHTDGRPYKSQNYDNWRLSTARAQMAYYMLVRGGVQEKRFEAIQGYADRALRVASDPGAAQNRRIEILLRKVKA
jgi:chemotaxis protein MotB